MPTCSKGYIKRKGYTRKVGSKKIRVASKCIKSTSQSGLKRSDIDKKKLSRLRKLHEVARSKFGTPKCKKGEIVREGTKTKKSYQRKSSWRKPSCTKAVGRASKTGKKGTPLFVLEKNVLSKYGYSKILSMKVSDRKSALLKAIKHLKPLSVARRLNALYVLNKIKSPKLAKVLRDDFMWLKTQY
jgi:hypothetical protein